MDLDLLSKYLYQSIEMVQEMGSYLSDYDSPFHSYTLEHNIKIGISLRSTYMYHIGGSSYIPGFSNNIENYSDNEFLYIKTSDIDGVFYISKDLKFTNISNRIFWPSDVMSMLELWNTVRYTTEIRKRNECINDILK